MKTHTKEGPSAATTVHAALTPTARRQLEAAAQARQVTPSIVVRWAVAEWLDRHEQAAA